jgi:hypothetical protein
MTSVRSGRGTHLEALAMGISPGSEDPRRDDLLATIKNGMKVVDMDGDKVGKVTFVRMADLNDPDDTPNRDTDPGLLAAVDNDFDDQDTLLDVFEGEDDVTERMRRTGYVKIDAAGFFTGDKYVEPAQIASVEGDTVRLAIDKDDIVKPA